MKKNRRINLVFLTLFLVISGCEEASFVKDPELQKLGSWMTGSFSSQEQAEADSNFYDIRLEMVPVWEDRDDAIWLYVEQAAASALDRPYRQRVYRLMRNDDMTFESAVFTFDKPLRFAGAWKDDLPLNQLTPDSLSERSGCAIILDYENGAFVGSTVDRDCGSQLRGASYATSRVRIEENVLTSWDRGFDSNDKHVWVSRSGPYVFNRVKNAGSR